MACRSVAPDRSDAHGAATLDATADPALDTPAMATVPEVSAIAKQLHAVTSWLHDRGPG